MRRLILDLDGTLIDSLADLTQSVNETLLACGYPQCSLADVRRAIGDGPYKLLERVSHAYPDEHTMDLFRRSYERNMYRAPRVYDGARETIADLRAAGWKIGVISNKQDGAAKALVRYLFGDAIDCTVGSRVGVPTKPDAMMWHIFAQACGVESQDECIYVGDSAVDARFALAAGISFIGAGWGFGDVRSAANATIASDWMQLRERLLTTVVLSV